MSTAINPLNIISLLQNHFKKHHNVSTTTLEEIQLSKHISSIIETAIKTNSEIEFTDELVFDENALSDKYEADETEYDFDVSNSSGDDEESAESSAELSEKSTRSLNFSTISWNKSSLWTPSPICSKPII